MAEETISKQGFNVRDLATCSVTLYPSRAQVVREINNITLKPGAHEITIFGITPTADESSIKVDGKGVATITDMTVDLVPNSEIFEDIYPSDSDSDSDSDDDAAHNSGEEKLHPNTDHMKDLERKIDELNEEINKIAEERDSASDRLAILKLYGDSMKQNRPDDLKSFLESYRVERKKAQEVAFDSEYQLTALRRELSNIVYNITEANKKKFKATRKEMKRKAKQVKKQQRARQEKETAKRHLKEDRAQFWPRKVYRVVVSLDTSSLTTPASSRRDSVDTLGKPGHEATTSDGCNISLSISYITSSANWAPRYDLSINTTTNSGLVIYRAEFCNTTSETWSDAKIVLSTSQTAFQGLGDPIPSMIPWPVKLYKKGKYNVDATSAALLSAYEQSYRHSGFKRNSKLLSEPREKLFGVDPAPPSEGIARECTLKGVAESDSGEDMGFGMFDDGPDKPKIPEPPALTTLESNWEESGLTANYPIPGLRTITPSKTTRRQKIASVDFKDVNLSYIMVPKLRAAAFLKARLHNTSEVTLLKGPCGLTLDGSFLGNTTLPRCSAGDFFSLSLGVDPSVNVVYSKPAMKRSQQGGLPFQKESVGVFKRAVTIANTKTNRVLEGTVMDQIPVSEDERLRVTIVQPSGLGTEGSTVTRGVGAQALDKTTEKWGKATATLKKNGEVCWDVKIEPGQAVKLALEYVARFPTTEIVIESGEEREDTDEEMGL